MMETPEQILQGLIPKIIIGLTKKHHIIHPRVAVKYGIKYEDDRVKIEPACGCGKIACYRCQKVDGGHVNMFNYNIHFKEKGILATRGDAIYKGINFNRYPTASDVYDIDTAFESEIEYCKRKYKQIQSKGLSPVDRQLAIPHQVPLI